MKIMAVLFCLSMALVVGCADSSTADKSGNEKSGSQQVIEGVTGKSAVDAGQKAKQVIKDVSAKEQENLDEVLNP